MSDIRGQESLRLGDILTEVFWEDRLGEGPIEPVIEEDRAYEGRPYEADGAVMIEMDGIRIWLGKTSYLYTYRKIAEDAIRRHLAKAMGGS